jgi:hypothetical protein
MMGNQDKITYQYTYRVPNQCSSEFSITFDKEAEPKLSIQTSFLPKVAISQNQKKNQKSLRNALSHLFTKLTQAN